MPAGRSLKTLISWIACAAFLVSAWAPTLAQAFRTHVPEGWAEICSVSGMQRVKVDDSGASEAELLGKWGLSGESGGSGKFGNSTDEGAGAHGLKHCPYCSTHSTVLGLPPAAQASLLLKSLASHVPALFLTAPQPLFAWASAQPRAPPHQA